MNEQRSSLKCKYTGCHDGINGQAKLYEACPACFRLKPWLQVGCCPEHAWMYQNQVAIARDEELPFPELIDRMIEEGVLDKSYDSNTVEELEIKNVIDTDEVENTKE
jgi:hypothetical protein